MKEFNKKAEALLDAFNAQSPKAKIAEVAAVLTVGLIAAPITTVVVGGAVVTGALIVAKNKRGG